MRPFVVVLAGLIAGADLVLLMPEPWLVHSQAGTTAGPRAWACPMLCTRSAHPGRCPVCGMELQEIAIGDGERIRVDTAQAEAMGLSTVKVERRPLARAIRCPGAIEPGLGAVGGERGALSVRIELFDNDLPWVAPGEAAEVTLDARPGQVLPGVVTRVATNAKPETRSTSAWLTVENPEGDLPVGALVSVTLLAALGPDGRSPAVSLAGRYRCRLHPTARGDRPGPCPVCGLPLAIDAQAGAAAAPDGPLLLALPRDAVLSLGQRHLVYLQTAPATFEPRAVQLGPRAGDWVMVRDGLAEGDVVARGGNLLLDSQMQLAGRTSLIAR